MIRFTLQIWGICSLEMISSGQNNKIVKVEEGDDINLTILRDTHLTKDR